MLGLALRRRARDRRPRHPGRRWRDRGRRLRPRLRPCCRSSVSRRSRRPSADLAAIAPLRGRCSCARRRVVLDLNGVVKGKTVDDALALQRRRLGLAPAATSPPPSRVDGRACRAAGCDPAPRGRPRDEQHRRPRAGPAAAPLQHHLIDPATGRPARTPWRDVTVAAQHCVAADVAAKAALLLGASGAVVARPARPPRPVRRRPRRGPGQPRAGAGRRRSGWRREPDRLVRRAVRGTRRVPAPVGVGDRRRAHVRAARASPGRASRSRSCTASSRSSPGSSWSLHGGSLLLDRVVPISLAQVLVPFASPYRPLRGRSRRNRRRADGGGRR